MFSASVMICPVKAALILKLVELSRASIAGAISIILRACACCNTPNVPETARPSRRAIRRAASSSQSSGNFRSAASAIAARSPTPPTTCRGREDNSVTANQAGTPPNSVRGQERPGPSVPPLPPSAPVQAQTIPARDRCARSAKDN